MDADDIANSQISQYEYRKIIGMQYQDITLSQEDIKALSLYKHGLFNYINGFLRGDLSCINERKSSEEISDGGNVCGLGDRSSDGIPYDSECGKYFFAYAHSGIDLRSALWMAVWADMWDFSAILTSPML